MHWDRAERLAVAYTCLARSTLLPLKPAPPHAAGIWPIIKQHRSYENGLACKGYPKCPKHRARHFTKLQLLEKLTARESGRDEPSLHPDAQQAIMAVYMKQ